MNKILKLAVLMVVGCLLVVPIHGKAMAIEHKTGYFSGVGDAEIFYQCWRVEYSRAVMIIVHGYGMSSDCNAEAAQHFAEMGISSYAFDLRGHGRSEGPRWNPESYEYYIDDLKTYVEMVKKCEPGKDIFMLGNSLGGGIVLKYAILHPEDLKGVIVAGPSVGAFLTLPIIGNMAAPNFLLKILSPLLRIVEKVMPDRRLPGPQSDPESVTHDPEFLESVENINESTGTPFPMKMRCMVESIKMILFLQDNTKNLVVPCLLMSGSEDIMVPPNSVKEFYDKVPIEDKKFIMYDGFRHALFYELWRDKVYQDVDAWLLPRLSC
jgi:alpha-beta hydrolase superfamily lysophospholipase